MTRREAVSPVRALDLANLRVLNVSKRFNQRWVLRDVSLQAEPGQLILLTGDNGSGKSTLFEILSGQISADSGSISLGSTTPLSLQANTYIWERVHKRARRGIRVCRQAAPLFRSLTLHDHVGLADPRLVAHLNGERGSPPEAGSKELETPSALRQFEGDSRLPTELSLGQRRSFAIERQIAFSPLLCLLDEPLAGLDDRAVSRIRDDLRLAKTQRSITILIEHKSNISKIADLVDECHELHDGILHEINITDFIETNGRSGKLGAGLRGADVRQQSHGGESRRTSSEVTADFQTEVVIDASSDEGKVPPLVSELAATPLRLRLGETLTLAAPNGWGKSTLCDAIAGADRVFPFAVRLMAGGRDLSGLSPHKRCLAGIAMLRGAPSYPAKTKVSFLYKLYGVEPSSRTRPFQSRYTSTLSGGEMRIVQLELVLCRGISRYAILDEPFLGLDNSARVEAASLIRGFAPRGTVVIFEPTDM